MAAAGFVYIALAQQHGGFFDGFSETELGNIAAAHANGVKFGDVIGHGQHLGHGAKGAALEVHIQSGHNDPYACAGKLFSHLRHFGVKELGLINTHHIHIVGQQQDLLRMLDGRARDAGLIVRNNVHDIVTGIYGGIEYFHLQVRDLGALQAADQLFGLSAEHGAAHHFDPSLAGTVFVMVSGAKLRLYEHWQYGGDAILLGLTKIVCK